MTRTAHRSPEVFTTERRGRMTAVGFRKQLAARIDPAAPFPSLSTRT